MVCKVEFAGCDFGHEEIDAVNRVMAGTWLASGKENEQFEEEFAQYVGSKYSVCVNSGSLANLIALQSLGLEKGDKVMTAGCGFPATLSPILHLGLEPVIVDYDINTHNVDIVQVLEKMDGIKAMIFAHTMGNPVDIDKIKLLADKRGIKIIEDCCEAIGAELRGRKVGSVGDIGTFSLYPAHQITALGGGGMITTNDKALANEFRSLRDWGKVYDWDSYLGDHKTKYSHEINGIKYFKHYTYNSIGYNAKLPEANAAFGREQLKKLPLFVMSRLLNYEHLESRLPKDIFVHVDVVPDSVPSWFGLIMTLVDGRWDRNNFGDYLEENGIRTRPFFAGNITRHKPFKKYEMDLPVADKLMRDSLFVGVWQGINHEMIDYMGDVINNYFSK